MGVHGSRVHPAGTRFAGFPDVRDPDQRSGLRVRRQPGIGRQLAGRGGTLAAAPGRL
jgi:hypothetical protein